MRLFAALALVCGAHRISEHVQSADMDCKLDHRSIPNYANFRAYDDGDSDSGLMPQLNVKGGPDYYEIREHTNFFKTSEYSFHRINEDNVTSSCGRFHTYWLGRSADLRVGKAGQRKRLIRITSARHGNALENIENQIYYIRGKKKEHVYYTIVRKRISQLGGLSYLLGIPAWRGFLIAPGKLVTHATRHIQKGQPDVYKIMKGKCKYGGEEPSKEPDCGKQIMTGIGTFGDWGMNWYMGAVSGNTHTKLDDAVASLQFQSERWGKASAHKKQIFRLGVKSGDVGLIVINAFLADILRAMELANMKNGHNIWNMDMR